MLRHASPRCKVTATGLPLLRFIHLRRILRLAVLARLPSCGDDLYVIIFILCVLFCFPCNESIIEIVVVQNYLLSEEANRRAYGPLAPSLCQRMLRHPYAFASQTNLYPRRIIFIAWISRNRLGVASAAASPLYAGVWLHAGVLSFLILRFPAFFCNALSYVDSSKCRRRRTNSRPL